MLQENIVLLVILGVGVFFSNHLVAASAGSLLVVKWVRWQSLLLLLDRRAMDIGLFFLLTGVLTPFALKKIGPPEILATFQSLRGVVAVVGGVLAAYVCGKGLVLLNIEPEVIVGLVVGTVIGVALLKGIPVGPLAAAGFTAVLLKLLRLAK